MSSSKIALYDDPQALLDRTVMATSDESSVLIDDVQYFEVESTFEWIASNNYKRVALQFPDSLLQHSSAVYEALLARCLSLSPAPIMTILADTAYGQCCVDEVAAEHFAADCIVHYGPACLSATQRLPVKYVFGKSPLSVCDMANALKAQFPAGKVVLFYDVQYHHLAYHLEKMLNTEFPENALLARLDLDTQSKPEAQSTKEGHLAISFCGRILRESGSGHLDEWNIVFLGEDTRTLTNIIMTFNQATVFTYTPATGLVKQTLSSNKVLMRRFYLIERAKDAEIIGILVGTLAVSQYLEMIQHLQEIIKKAGKTYYTFVVGKLNVPKLANFQEVDLFVVVACPENSILDSKDFFKPVVTPFELEIALVPGKAWNNRYSVEFKAVLEDAPTADYFASSGAEEAEDTRVSLVSRQIKLNHKALAQEMETEHEASDPELALTTRNNNHALIQRQAPTAMDFFLQRSYKGLQQLLGETPVVDATVGRPGLPMEYAGEPSSEQVDNNLDDEIQRENA